MGDVDGGRAPGKGPFVRYVPFGKVAKGSPWRDERRSPFGDVPMGEVDRPTVEEVPLSGVLHLES